MNTPAEQQLQPKMSLGERFRQTRIVLNLTVDDVVARTNLNASIINKLENDEFDGKSIPATFVNGYIRSYAQFLKMPEEQWKNVELGQKIENDLNKNARTGRVTNPYSSIGRWVWYLTVLVILLAGAMTALWWWETYQQSNSERDKLVQNYASVEENSTSSQNSVSLQSIEPSAVTTVSPAVTGSAPANSQPVALSVAPPSVTENVAQPATTDTPLTVQVMPIENTAQAVLKQHTAEQTKAEEIQNPEDAAANQNASAVTDSDLHIEITGANCWITVRDGNRNVLAQKEYKQGEILTFNQGAPYSLTIGAPGNVKITYKGQPYPLKVDGRVARFKLE